MCGPLILIKIYEQLLPNFFVQTQSAKAQANITQTNLRSTNISTYPVFIMEIKPPLTRMGDLHLNYS